MFELNPALRAYVKWIGDREAPLVCIDDLYLDPDALRAMAVEMEFPKTQAFYPGRHQPLENDIPGVKDFKVQMAALVGQAIRKTVPVDAVDTDFSILTTPEYKLLGQQGQPHIDGVPMLGVVYLNDEDYGGTVFFRNRTTNSATVITAEQQAHYEAFNNGELSAKNQVKYITDSDDDWEVLYITEGKKNSLVMWPGTVWHSIQVKIPPETGGLANKRLTQRVIVNAAQ